MNPDIYPLTVTKDRYCGTHSGGCWTAWNCKPNMIPEATFMVVGKGDTPEAAINDLANKLYS